MEIIIKNNTDLPQQAKLFGSNKNYLSPRFGNPEGIEITIEDGDEYKRLLAHTQFMSFAIKSFLAETFNNGYKKNDKIITTLNRRDRMIGHMMFVSLGLTNRVRKKETVIVDGDTEIQLDIKPNSKIVLDIEIESKLSVSELNQKQQKEEKKKVLLIIK